MARPRKNQHSHSKNNGNSSSSSSEIIIKSSTSVLTYWKSMIGTCFLAVAVYFGVLGYLETRVNTPFNSEQVVKKTGLSVPDRFWGSYRPGLYFGLRLRDPKSPLLGLMWYNPDVLLRTSEGIRHWCSHDDNIQKYSWTEHDGYSGIQEIYDQGYKLTTSFIKRPSEVDGGHWTARIQVENNNWNWNVSNVISLIWYSGVEDSEQNLYVDDDGVITGDIPGIVNNYKIHFVTEGRVMHISSAATKMDGPHIIKESIMDTMRLATSEDGDKYILLHNRIQAEDINLAAVQITGQTPLTVDVVYTTSNVDDMLYGAQYTRQLEQFTNKYRKQFNAAFPMKGFTAADTRLAMAAVSNLIGGVGYFYGAGRVKSPYTVDSVPYWRAPLYTAVPSRSNFPRGFLWDEGFHGIITSRFNMDIYMDIVGHWMDLINVEGWIPREQILGTEALARVPAEFVVQSNAAANPPMLLITLADTVRRRPEMFGHNGVHRQTLHRLWPRLEVWFHWFNTTQRGNAPSSYRWRGRDPDTKLELNPKTLTSGLDDYPRASHPTDEERHVDLRCWIYAAADALATIAHVLELDGQKYTATRALLGDEELLNKLHWSSVTLSYGDYGYHTDGVHLERAAVEKRSGGQHRSTGEQPPLVRVVQTSPRYGLVTSSLGYVSLFPVMMKILNPDSPRLGAILNWLDDPELLWTDYGLRSLSKSSPLYRARNTEHDPPYWRGQIWLNMNYLVLTALDHYSRARGLYSARAHDLYTRLRMNLLNNVLGEYRRTGYLWEHYSELDGTGSGCRPFTGWTSLIVVIMTEHY